MNFSKGIPGTISSDHRKRLLCGATLSILSSTPSFSFHVTKTIFSKILFNLSGISFFTNRMTSFSAFDCHWNIYKMFKKTIKQTNKEQQKEKQKKNKNKNKNKKKTNKKNQTNKKKPNPTVPRKIINSNLISYLCLICEILNCVHWRTRLDAGFHLINEDII